MHYSMTVAYIPPEISMLIRTFIPLVNQVIELNGVNMH